MLSMTRECQKNNRLVEEGLKAATLDANGSPCKLPFSSLILHSGWTGGVICQLHLKSVTVKFGHHSAKKLAPLYLSMQWTKVA